MVVINCTNGKVVSAQVFDTYKSSDELDIFLLKEIPKGYIVIAACKDECVKHLSWNAKKWFTNMGSKEIWQLGERCGYAFVGVSGAEVYEKRAETKEEQVSMSQIFKIDKTASNFPTEDEDEMDPVEDSGKV